MSDARLLLERHALPTTIGVAFGIARAVYVIEPEGLSLFALVFFPSLGVQEVRLWSHRGVQTLHAYSIQSPAEFGQIQDFIESGGHPELPFVIGQGMVYFQ
jgi:hypothetical protein